MSIIRKVAAALVRVLASVQLAIGLLVLLAVVLAVATFVESSHGREYARYYIYTRGWFMALLGLLGTNVLVAALVRFPWKPRQIPFLVTHAGILVLLAGSVETFVHGVEGRLALANGAAADTIVLPEKSSVVVRWTGAKARKDGTGEEFVFDSGPEDWPSQRKLDLGEIDGAKVVLRSFLAHASLQSDGDIVSADPESEEFENSRAAIRADVTVGGVKHKAWLIRGDIGKSWSTINTAEGTLQIGFGYQSAPLDFAVRLIKFTRTSNPGGMGDAAFASTVEVLDATSTAPVQHEISMNEPLVTHRYAFYQSSILPGDSGSVFTVAYDPGLTLKYVGSLMICLGTVWMFLLRANVFDRLLPRKSNNNA